MTSWIALTLCLFASACGTTHTGKLRAERQRLLQKPLLQKGCGLASESREALSDLREQASRLGAPETAFVVELVDYFTTGDAGSTMRYFNGGWSSKLAPGERDTLAVLANCAVSRITTAGSDHAELMNLLKATYIAGVRVSALEFPGTPDLRHLIIPERSAPDFAAGVALLYHAPREIGDDWTIGTARQTLEAAYRLRIGAPTAERHLRRALTQSGTSHLLERYVAAPRFNVQPGVPLDDFTPQQYCAMNADRELAADRRFFVRLFPDVEAAVAGANDNQDKPVTIELDIGSRDAPGFVIEGQRFATCKAAVAAVRDDSASQAGGKTPAFGDATALSIGMQHLGLLAAWHRTGSQRLSLWTRPILTNY